jgi:hypothetical protein
MPLYKCLHNLLIVYVEVANKMGLQKNLLEAGTSSVFVTHGNNMTTKWHSLSQLLPCSE